MAELQIKIGADVSSAVAGLNKVQTELDQTGKSAVALGGSVNQATANISKLPQAANQAGTAVGNLSRIVQDAPFGFIAISNNLQPLFDDFTRLKAQTGSTGGALKSLVGAIAGPAGIGLAFAAATSLITVFSKEIFGAGSAAKKAKSDVDEFNKSLDQAKASAISSGLQLQKFVEIAKDGNLPLQQRNEALDKANKILGEYGQKLTLTNVATAQATELVNQYTQGLIAQALANQYADRAATLLINQAKAQQEVTKAQLNYNKAQQQFLNQPTRTTREQELGRGEIYITQRDAALKALNERQKEYADITAEVTDITKQFNDQALKSTALLGGAGKPAPKAGNVQLDFTPIQGISQRTQELFDSLKNEALQFGPDYYKELEKGFKDLKEIKVPFRVNLSAAGQEIQNTIKENGKAFESFAAQVNASIASIQVEGISALAEGIGTALGGGNVQNAFKAFGDIIASGLQTIGKQFIAWGGLAKLAQQALAQLFTNPGLALATGVGLVAAGAALKAALSGGIKARALGGPVSGGEPYLVGERGPELFVPSVSGGIVANNSVGAFMSGRQSGQGSSSVLRGQDILLAYARTQRSQLRVNG